MMQAADDERTLALRGRMVDGQIGARGIADAEVLAAMRDVPRHCFAVGHDAEAAYGDHALPIGRGQTISQPYMVAIMSALLVRKAARRGRALEIGTGSGYQAAILSRLFAEVVSVERIEGLAAEAGERLALLGYGNVRVVRGDGTLGHAPGAPYDAIVVTAAAPHLPAALEEQLADGGVLVAPVGTRGMQTLVVVEKRGGERRETREDGCVFVPLIGKDGWEE